MSSEIQVDIKISEIKEQYLQALDNLHLKAEEEILDEVPEDFSRSVEVLLHLVQVWRTEPDLTSMLDIVIEDKFAP